jgi:hypothetical protein
MRLSWIVLFIVRGSRIYDWQTDLVFLGIGSIGSHCLMATEFKFLKMTVLEIEP